jgi:peroxiredoxin
MSNAASTDSIRQVGIDAIGETGWRHHLRELIRSKTQRITSAGTDAPWHPRSRLLSALPDKRLALAARFERRPRMQQLFNGFVLLGLALTSIPPVVVAEDIGLTPMPERPAAPTFQLADADGKPHRLDDLHGAPAIVNFWATWCPPCRAEMPAMQRASEQLAADGVAVIAINVGESADTVRTFRDEIAVTFPLLLDPDSSVSQRWPMRGLPTTFILNPDGSIAYKAEGERVWDHPELLAQVRELAAEAEGTGIDGKQHASAGADGQPNDPDD